jgi:hypothetical protein
MVLLSHNVKATCGEPLGTEMASEPFLWNLRRNYNVPLSKLLVITHLLLCGRYSP